MPIPLHPMRVVALAAALALAITATAVGSPAPDRVERRVIEALSHARASHGLPPLRPHRALHRVADVHSRRMARAGRLAHGRWWQRLRPVARGRAGETIAVVGGRGRRLARRVVAMWMASPPHRAILLDPGVRRIGVARRPGPRGWYFTADVAQRAVGR